MANREHQGLMATVIVLVMLVVALTVSTYVFYRKAEDYYGMADAAKTDKDNWKKKFDDENFKLQFALHVLGVQTLDNVQFGQVRQGVAADENMKKVDAEFEKFTKMFEKSMPQGQTFNFLSLPEILLTALRSKSEQVLDRETARQAALNDKKITVESENQARLIAEAAQKKAADDLDLERDTYNKNREALQQKQETQLANFQSQFGEFKKQVEDAQKLADTKEKENKTIRNTLELVQKKVDDLQPTMTFETAHGRIVWVNESTNTVWINLGRSDGLRRQTTFSVFDHETTGVEKAPRKGSIEVIEVVDQHLAEAKVLDEADPKNPLLPGDQVFSPTWRPGRRVNFAIIGFIDANGDGVADRDLVRNVITMNGGEIEAEVYDDGHVEGKLSAQTNYLVLGDSPALQRTANAEALKQYNAMYAEARNLGIKMLSVDELLNLMGWKGGLKTVNLGRSADPKDFKAKSPDNVTPESTGNTSGLFKERRPPQGDDGAF